MTSALDNALGLDESGGGLDESAAGVVGEFGVADGVVPAGNVARTDINRRVQELEKLTKF